MPAKDLARDAVLAAATRDRDDIVKLCREIHADPEPAGAELRTAERIIAFLEARGFEVERELAGLPSAFRARKLRHNRAAMRKGARHAEVGFILELDGDPTEGHTHGHNAGIAAVLTAALGTTGAFEEEYATVTVIGCPGTVGEGGKLALHRAGVFEQLDVVFGAQPAATGRGFFATIANTGETLGSLTVGITFVGEGGEAAAGELAGALVRLRATTQDIESVELLSHERAAARFRLLAPNRKRLTELSVELQLAAKEIGERHGATAEMTFTEIYDETLVSRVLARRVKTWTDTLKVRLDKIQQGPPGPPSDWGNLSYVVPAFQAHYPIVTRETTFGTSDFASAANTPEAYEQSVQIGQCIAFAALDVIRDPVFRAVADDQLVKATRERGVARQHRRWTGLHPVMRDSDPDEPPKKSGPKVREFKWVRGPGIPNE